MRCLRTFLYGKELCAAGLYRMKVNDCQQDEKIMIFQNSSEYTIVLMFIYDPLCYVTYCSNL